MDSWSGPGTGILLGAFRGRSAGPVLGVMPWNYPYYQVARFAAPNLIAGNTVILKHAENCPASALAIAGIMRDAGVPDGVYITLFATHEQVAVMIADPRLRGVSLTGSERAAELLETGLASLSRGTQTGGRNSSGNPALASEVAGSLELGS